MDFLNLTTESFTDSAVTDLIPVKRVSKFGGKTDLLLSSYYVISALGIPGNILTIFVLCSNPSLRNKPINIFIIHQSVIDICACVFTILEEFLIQYRFNGQVLCHLFHTKYASGGAMTTSTYNMVALTIERHFAIVDPLHYDAEKVKKRLPFIFAFVWIYCYGAMAYLSTTTIYRDSFCFIINRIFRTVFWEHMPTYLCCVQIGLPVVVIVFCYSRMFHALYSSSRSFGNKSARNANADKLRLAQLNIFQTCLIMITMFLICWLSLNSAILLFIFKVYTDLSGTHFSIGNILVILNSGINPYIYVFRYDDFKIQLKKLLLKNTDAKYNPKSTSAINVSSQQKAPM